MIGEWRNPVLITLQGTELTDCGFDLGRPRRGELAQPGLIKRQYARPFSILVLCMLDISGSRGEELW